MDLPTQEMGPTLSHEEFVTSKEISPDGKVVATTSAGMVDGIHQPVLTLWDADSGEILRQIAIPTYSSTIAFSPNGDLLAVGTEEGLIFYTAPQGEKLFKIDTSEQINCIAFSPDGVKLVTCGSDSTISFFEVME
jgi:WD40 repeat protein